MACEPYAGLMRRRREGLVSHGGLGVDGVPMKSGTPTLPEKESDAIKWSSCIVGHGEGVGCDDS